MSKRKLISQREARALKQRVEELERAENRRRSVWASDYVGGVNIATLTYDSSQAFIPAVISTSRRLGHAVVATCDGSTVRFHALPLGSKS